MGMVAFTVSGRRYELACRDGEEARLRTLAAMVDQKAIEAGRALGEASEPRQLLFAALLLADELSDLRDGAAPPPDDGTAAAIDTIARQIETLAERLENGAARS